MRPNCDICEIRSWHPEDMDELARHANDRNVWLNLRDKFPHPYTREDAEAWIRYASGWTHEGAQANSQET